MKKFDVYECILQIKIQVFLKKEETYKQLYNVDSSDDVSYEVELLKYKTNEK